MPVFWNQKNFFVYCLLPLSAIYHAVIVLRKFLYRLNLKKTTYFNVPVIVVGNITVGGTGKTPLVIWLANFLKSYGFKPGIVSRGYGGKADYYPYAVDVDSDPHKVGDESLLLARNTQCPIIIDPKRVRAVKKLLEVTDCNIIISDDGMQHYALARAIEIAVIDGQKRFGNKFCLPAGPLREPVSRLDTVDFLVCNGQALKGEIEMQLISGNAYSIADISRTCPIEHFKNKKIAAVAGIGNPTRFFNMLRKRGLTITEHAFPDHYAFQASDLKFDDDVTILMTEKDAVKCENFATNNMWCLPVKAHLPEDFQNKILSKINESVSTA